MKNYKKLLRTFVPSFDRWQVIILILFSLINAVFLSVVVNKNGFELSDYQVLASFSEKIIFDGAFILFSLLLLKAIFRSGWIASLFIVFNALLALSNILIYYFGNTMLEKHHFALITPYSVTAFVPWYALIAILVIVVVSLVVCQKMIKKIRPENLYRKALFFLLLMLLLTALNTSHLFKKKNDERLDRVIMGFRNAQLYYTCRNQFLSFIKDVIFPTLGEKLRSFSPATEKFVDDYNLFSDDFTIETTTIAHAKTIKKWHIPLGETNLPDLNLKPFKRVIYLFTESLSLEMLPCYNNKLKAEFASEFFCTEAIQKVTFQNLYTTGSPTLQGLTVIFNSHPNYNIQEPTGQINSFPKLLEKQGYTTIFMRSASKYFANENLIFNNMGFSQVIGREDFYEDEQLRKYIYGWGLEDRILYEKAVEYLEKNRNKKVFLSIFGTDTHPPHGQKNYKHLSYPKNENLRKKVPRHIYKWLRSIDRMDFDISNLLKQLEKKGLFDESTLVIISADHSCPLNNVSSKIPGHAKNNLAKIPLIFLSKQPLPHTENSVMASQVDIAPTIFHLLGLKKESGWWGDSLFNKKRVPFMVGFEKGFIRIRDNQKEEIINSKEPDNQSEQELINLFNTVIYDK